MGHAENELGAAHPLGEIESFLDRCGERFVADDVNACIEKGFGHGIVQIIGRDDGDGVDAVRARGLGASHFRVIGVGAVRGDVKIPRGGAALGGIGGKRGSHEFILIIEARSDAMHRADKRAGAATDHAQPEAPICLIRLRRAGCTDSHGVCT